TWSWEHDAPRFTIAADSADSAHTTHPALGHRWWYIRADRGTDVDLLFTENDTNAARLFDAPGSGAFVKDGINDAVVRGMTDRVNRHGGSKAAADVRAMVGAGESFTVCVRLPPRRQADPFDAFDRTMALRRGEADAFYDGIHAPHLTADERLVQRQAFAGMLWSKQFYHFDVHRWLTGDPTQPAPPPQRLNGRNRDWALPFHPPAALLIPHP